MKPIAQRLEEVRATIAAAVQRAGRDPGSVRLVAVSKTVDLGQYFGGFWFDRGRSFRGMCRAGIARHILISFQLLVGGAHPYASGFKHGYYI